MNIKNIHFICRLSDINPGDLLQSISLAKVTRIDFSGLQHVGKVTTEAFEEFKSGLLEIIPNLPNLVYLNCVAVNGGNYLRY